MRAAAVVLDRHYAPTPDLTHRRGAAVGDRRFRSKSLRRIRDLREQASTVVMVTHNLGEIRKTCSRTIWLEDGQIVMDGATSEVLPPMRPGPQMVSMAMTQTTIEVPTSPRPHSRHEWAEMPTLSA